MKISNSRAIQLEETRHVCQKRLDNNIGAEIDRDYVDLFEVVKAFASYYEDIDEEARDLLKKFS